MLAFDSTIGRNSHDVSPSATIGVSAVIVAVRGESAMSAISPK